MFLDVSPPFPGRKDDTLSYDKSRRRWLYRSLFAGTWDCTTFLEILNSVLRIQVSEHTDTRLVQYGSRSTKRRHFTLLWGNASTYITLSSILVYGNILLFSVFLHSSYRSFINKKFFSSWDFSKWNILNEISTSNILSHLIIKRLDVFLIKFCKVSTVCLFGESSV